MALPDILTVRECAEYLRLSEKVVRKLIWGGKIKALDLGGAVRIQRSALEKAVGITDSSSDSFGVRKQRKSAKNGYDDFLAEQGIKEHNA